MQLPKIVPFVLFFIFLNFNSKAQNILNESFNDTIFFTNWKISSNIEHAYLIGKEKSRFIRFHPKFQREFIQTPLIPILSTHAYNLFFDWNKASTTSVDSVQVQMSNDNGISWTTIKSIVNGNNRVWQTDSLFLGSLFGGNNISIRWLYFSSGIFPSQFFNLDNVRIAQANSPTAIRNNPSILNALIYPNPTRDIFLLKLNNMQLKNAELKIISPTGTIIRRYALPNSLESTTEIDVSSFSNGIYMITIETDAHQYSQPLIIQ